MELEKDYSLENIFWYLWPKRKHKYITEVLFTVNMQLTCPESFSILSSKNATTITKKAITAVTSGLNNVMVFILSSVRKKGKEKEEKGKGKEEHDELHMGNERAK